MNKKTLKTGALTLSLLASALLANGAMAAVSESEAAKLGDSLTPVGAEKAGNAAGTIPAWTGGLPTDAAGVSEDGFVNDPFPDEKPKFTITAQNFEQYKDNLSPGQIAIQGAWSM